MQRRVQRRQEEKEKTIAGVLADTLLVFSLDVVNIVRAYLLFGTATPRVSPVSALITQSLVPRVFGVASGPNNEIWTTSKETVRVFGPKGDGLFDIEPFWSALGITFAGNVFIVDSGAHAIVECSPSGEIVRKIGKKGLGNGLFCFPRDIAVDAKRQLMFVTCKSSTRVVVLDINGNFVRALGHDRMCMLPQAVAVNSAGEVAVSDIHSHKIQVWFTCAASSKRLSALFAAGF